MGVMRRGKTEKHGKVENGGGSYPGWYLGNRPLDARRNREANIDKGWEDKRDRGLIPDTFT